MGRNIARTFDVAAMIASPPVVREACITSPSARSAD
jgi:hypothetical protein